MQIYGPYRVSTPDTVGVNRPQPQRPPETASRPSATPVDQLDLSSTTGVNRIENSAIAGGGEIRIERVAELRRQIADGSYETPEKLDAALDRLLDQIG
ncbi:MAG: flagellar biosynthesis anti-sigma factor FlgM [Planctomycetota bacterium]